jgi:hypothetical protein
LDLGSDSEGTLFRATSLTSRLVGLFMKAHGASWLHAVIGDFVVDTLTNNLPMEVQIRTDFHFSDCQNFCME